jgi:hypothetical protein
LIFSAPFFFCKVPHSKKNSAKYYHKCTRVLMLSTRYSCQILKLDFFYSFRKILEVSTVTKVRPVGAQLFRADRRTDVAE